ncbi:hypothetical protein ZWY2020_018348 [Hordeum vulgare]|nr:hypothetical protein ZWY2020_018348 [Hordeum vulgare]
MFILRSPSSLGGTSAVDSTPSGNPSTCGNDNGMNRRWPNRCDDTGRSLARFRGVEMKVMPWPRAARRLESSRKGSNHIVLPLLSPLPLHRFDPSSATVCPNASHGNITTSICP